MYGRGLSKGQVLEQLQAAANQLDLSEYFPVSAKTGAGVPALVDHLIERLPPGPRRQPRRRRRLPPRA